MKEEERLKKTTVVLSADLHRRARIRAAELETDFRVIVIRALEEFLSRPTKKGGRSG
ncbi:MAG: hypothetical protein WEB59_02000 [Thermoanaerobaculia bacterium]